MQTPERLNNQGVELFRLGRYQEAEQRYRQALAIDPAFPDALCNLAEVLQANPGEAERWLRRALEVNPNFPGVHTRLGLLYQSSGRHQEAKVALRRALESCPDDAVALVGVAHVARAAGRFDEAQLCIRRALEIRPRMPTAWAFQQSIRKMGAADGQWCATVEELADSGLALWEESELRFALGKYYDDVGNFDRAFASFRRGNELLESVAPKYDATAHSALAADLVRTCSREAMTTLAPGGCDSGKPVFVVGMPRSGTSLVEQIIASHPAAAGAGEVDFWPGTAHANNAMREQLAQDYLGFLERRFPTASRIVDKTPANSQFVGLIHAAIPNARFIGMRRDPLDVCLSCYFQRFSTALSFTFDLTDLAAYYRTHRRLMAHWRAVLPAETLLEVPYEELVADQEGWTRKILDFLGLEWDARCLSFYATQRSVNTASAWQVRQQMYRNSVGRWRNYKKFIGPLEDLRD